MPDFYTWRHQNEHNIDQKACPHISQLLICMTFTFTVAQHNNDDRVEAHHRDLSDQDVIMAEQRDKSDIKASDTGKQVDYQFSSVS